jgi:hypothetical protein
VISDGYGVAIPKSGIAMGAVFENVAVPVQGVGVGRASGTIAPPCVLIAREEPIAPKAAMPAATKKSKQRTGRTCGRVNLPCGFVVMESPVSIGLVSGNWTPQPRF